MTATAPRTEIPPFRGEPVSGVRVKIVGAGTGFTGLDVKPIVMEMGDRAYVVAEVVAEESESHVRDNDGNLIRLQRLHMKSMAPMSEATAQRALQAYAREIEKAKAALDNQESLFAENEAAAAEAADLTDTPDEIAAAAKKRATREQH